MVRVWANVTTGTPRIEIRPPTLFTFGAVVISSIYGLLLIIPVLGIILAVTVFKYGVLTFLVPLAGIAVATFFLPLGFGNPFITRLVRPLRKECDANGQVWTVQFTAEPRMRSGLRGLAEDADDVGLLWYTQSALEFKGDAVRLTVPYDCIAKLGQQSAGIRALFLYGAQMVVTVPGLAGIDALRFAERASWILPSSRQNARQMCQALREKMAAAPNRPPGAARPEALRRAAEEARPKDKP